MTITRKYLLIHILLIVTAAVAFAIVYPHIPVQVAVHWNHHQPDRFVARKTYFWMNSPILFILCAFLLLTYLGPWLSPKQFEIENFRSTYLRIMTISMLLCAYLIALKVWAALGHRLNVARAIWCGAFLVVMLNGNLVGKMRRNFFIGVKTPWTLTSERVWNATHRLTAQIMVVAGLLGLVLVAINPRHWNAYVISIVVATAVVPRLYSLILYKQLERRGEL